MDCCIYDSYEQCFYDCENNCPRARQKVRCEECGELIDIDESYNEFGMSLCFECYLNELSERSKEEE